MADAAHRPGRAAERRGERSSEPGATYRQDGAGEATPRDPRLGGHDRIVSQEIRIVGPNGEKVDVMTFRGSFERDLKEFAETDPDFSFG